MATLPTTTQDSALVRGVRSSLQGAIGTLIAFMAGLVLAVMHVPGVNETVLTYVGSNLPGLMAGVGVPVGLTAFVWNVLRKDVPNF